MYTEIYFKTEDAAQKALKDAGFSLGKMQRDAPRGIMFGDIEVMKWRNLSEKDVVYLHGVYQRRSRGGPVRIMMLETAPKDAVENLKSGTQ